MSQDTPNLRVGLEVQIFGQAEMRMAQRDLRRLGTAITDLEEATVEINGVQTRYYRGIVRATGATAALRRAENARAEAVIRAATAGARYNSVLRDTENVAQQAQRALRNLQRQQEAIARNRRTFLGFQYGGGAGGGGTVGGGGRYGDVGPGAQFSGMNLGRVIAYDLLRRSLTNLYQGFNKIQETLADWVVESVKFNDEIVRAKTVFQGLGMMGTKNAAGEQMSLNEARISTDPRVRSVLAQSEKNSDDMIRGLMKISAETGSDMDEVISSARQILPDLINKRAKAGMPNPYLERPDELNKLTQEMVQLAAVLKMSDPGGRPLKWHMFALQEAFQGTSGSGKDKGMEAVKSLRTREGIRVRDEDAIKLAKAVNTGDLVEAGRILTDVLERSGQGIVNLKNMLSKTLQPNIDGVVMALRVLGKDLTQIFHKDLINYFYTLREGLTYLINDKQYKAAMERLGKRFADTFRILGFDAIDALQKVIDDPTLLEKYLNPVIDNFKVGVQIFEKGMLSVGNFLRGFLGNDLGLENINAAMDHMVASSYDAGVNMNMFTNSLMTFINIVSPLISMVNPLFDAFALGIATITSAVSYFLNIINQIPVLEYLIPDETLQEGGAIYEADKAASKYILDRTGFDLGNAANIGVSENEVRLNELNNSLQEMKLQREKQRKELEKQMYGATGSPIQPGQGTLARSLGFSKKPTNPIEVNTAAKGYRSPGDELTPWTPRVDQKVSATLKVEPKALMDSFKVMKPIQLNNPKVEQPITISISSMTVKADNVDGIVNEIKSKATGVTTNKNSNATASMELYSTQLGLGG